MKHFYSLALVLAVLLFPFAASAQDLVNFTINIDNGDAVTVTANYSTNVSVTTGDNSLSYAPYTRIEISAKDGYVLLGGTTFDGYEMTPSGGSLSVYIYSSDEGKTMYVRTVSEEDYYTGSFDLYIDDPSKATVQFTGTYRYLDLQEGWNTVKFAPAAEIALLAKAADYGSNLYQVLNNSVTVTPSTVDGSFTTSVSEGCKIEIFANFPEENVPVHCVFVNPGTEDFLQSFVVDGVTYPAEEYLADDFSLPLGSKVTITPNTKDFEVTSSSLSVNDVLKYFYSPQTIQITQETTFTFNVKRYATITKIINVKGAEYFQAYAGNYASGNPIELKDGVNEYTYNTSNAYLTIQLSTIGQLDVLKDGDKDLLPEYGPYAQYFALSDEGELTIEASEIQLDKTMVVYVDDLSQASTYFSFVNYNRVNVPVVTGYTVVPFTDTYVPYNVSWYGPSFNNLYLNNEKQQGLYGSSTLYQLNAVDGDVYKIFFTCDPELVTLSFENEATSEVSAVCDIITPIENLDETLEVFPGTLVRLTAEEGKQISVKVGDEPAVEGEEVEFTVTEAANVVISDTSTTAVDNVTVADAKDGNVYNLQGIKVAEADAFSTLPAGLYIVNGQKVIKK